MTDPFLDPVDDFDAPEQPMERPFEPPTPLLTPDDLYMDPTGPALDAREQRTEDALGPPARFLEPDVFYMDRVGRMAEALEAKIEQTEVPPPESLEPPMMPGPELGAPASIGPAPADPPHPRDAERLPWVGLQPAPAARLQSTRNGLGPPARQSRGGGGAGRYMAGSFAPVRRCPETKELVSEECGSCPRYHDAEGAGPICDYDREEDTDHEADES
jgi:hypothetical protein